MKDVLRQALAILGDATVEAIQEELTLLGCADPDAATRAEAAIRLLAADDDAVPFWAAVIGGHTTEGAAN